MYSKVFTCMPRVIRTHVNHVCVCDPPRPCKRAAQEEVVGEEEGVPEDESLPPRGGVTCLHPRKGWGGRIDNHSVDNSVSFLKTQIV